MSALTHDEPLATRWGRRVRSIGAHVVASTLLVATLPVVLPLMIVTDVLRGARFGATRFLGMIAVYLACEQLGVLTSGWLWLTRARAGGASRD